MAVYRLDNPLQNYSWGSPEFIPQLLRQAVKGTPVAEMWLGAHPTASSMLQASPLHTSLYELILRNPAETLGGAVDVYASQLPFLMKVLAAAQSLSIQAHPNKAQALLGFERENAAGIPSDSPLRNYKDSNHKPELICALTPFRLMCGFRPYAEIVQNFRLAGLFDVFPALGVLDVDRTPQNLKQVFLQVMQVSASDKQIAVDKLLSLPPSDPGLHVEILQTCLLLQQQHPGDTGILAPLFLNIFTLEPGEALFLAAGVLHSYLEGAGIEVMANSDNVLRGGLTPKHSALDELVRILSFTPYMGEKIVPAQPDPDTLVYTCPAEEFYLRRVHLNGTHPYKLETNALPLIALCVEGELSIKTEMEHNLLHQGESVFVSAESWEIVLEGVGSIWLTSVPEAQN